MASTLDLSNTKLQDACYNIQEFFKNNTWALTWRYHEDQIILDAMNADFLETLDFLAKAINQVNDIRGALHIHLNNIEKANTPLKPILTFHDSIIGNHGSFDGYNLYVFAHGDEGLCVNMNTVSI